MKSRFLVLSILGLTFVGCDTPTPKEAPEQKPEPAQEPDKPKPAPTSNTKVQITDLVVGKGAEAKDFRLAIVNYTGRLADGKVFDSNIGPDKDPFSFPIGTSAVIKGWDQGILGMRAGGKRKLVVPAELAYGAAGSPPTIPPNSELTFEIELLDVLKPEDRNAYEVTVIKPGTGPKSKAGDTISVEYTGKLLNGKIFDSSIGRDPLTFVLGKKAVIKGFDAGLTGVQVGGQYKIWIAPDAGYGPQGSPPKIPGNSVLIFEVTVKKIS
jgi:FKBP-type peptidyl-prolyl cis-trans isomerase